MKKAPVKTIYKNAIALSLCAILWVPSTQAQSSSQLTPQQLAEAQDLDSYQMEQMITKAQKELAQFHKQLSQAETIKDISNSAVLKVGMTLVFLVGSAMVATGHFQDMLTRSRTALNQSIYLSEQLPMDIALKNGLKILAADGAAYIGTTIIYRIEKSKISELKKAIFQSEMRLKIMQDSLNRAQN